MRNYFYFTRKDEQAKNYVLYKVTADTRKDADAVWRRARISAEYTTFADAFYNAHSKDFDAVINLN